MDDILKKLKGTLEESDLEKFEAAVAAMVDEKVELRVLEEKKKLEIHAEEFTTKEVEKRLSEKELELQESFDEKKKEFEKELVEKVDKFLEAEINENISEESIEKMATNEVYKPVVEAVMQVFEEKFVALDTEGHAILKEAKTEIEETEEKLSSEMAKTIELVSENDKLKSELLITQKTEGLTETQKERVTNILDSKDFKEVEAKIESVIQVVSESNTEETPADDPINEDLVPETDDVLEEQEKKKLNKEKSLSDIANLVLE